MSESGRQGVESEYETKSRLSTADLFLALRDVCFERLTYGRIHRRLLIFFERFLPEPRRALGGVQSAGFLPRLVILPVGQHRLIEGGRIAFQRMRLAEEMPAGRHATERVERK